MSKIIDLDVLLEKKFETVKFQSKDGQEIVLKLKVNTEIALYSTKILKEGKSEFDQACEIVAFLINDQLKIDCDFEWVQSNIEWDYVLYIGARIAEYLTESMEMIEKKGSTDNQKNTGKKKKTR